MSRSPLLVLPALALALAACGGSSSSDSSNSGSTTTSQAPSPSVAAAAGATLDIQNFAYVPEPLTVTAGQVISVTNQDAKAHTVTSSTAGLFKADKIAKGTPVTFTAPAAAGTYTYICDYHPKMKGTLIVK
jgi:plastocyanin